MYKPLTYSRRLRGIAGAAAVFALSITAQARVTQIVIMQRTTPIFNGRSFGRVGQYEMLTGIATGEIDPSDRRNAVITDIQLAPRNARGNVEYSATFTIVKPLNMRRASGVMTYDIVNRGSHVVPFVLNRGGDPGDGFLYSQGDVLLWSGWQGDILPETPPTGSLQESIRVPIARNPDASSITGEVLSQFANTPAGTTTQQLGRNPMYGDIGSKGAAGRTPVTLDTTQATLISMTSESQSGVRSGVVHIPSSEWAFGDCRTVPFPGTPDATRICLKNGFNPALLYELVYIAKDPLVLGVGMAAIRDVVSFFRYAATDDAGTGNPLRNFLPYVIAYGASQSGRLLKSFLNLGFNEDEQSRKVWDAADTDIGAQEGPFNVRFANLGMTGNLYDPEFDGPFWWADYTDVVRNRSTWGLLHRCTATRTCPLIFETYGGAEFWYARASVGIAGTTGVEDTVVPSNVRRYYLSGTTHGGGSGGFKIAQPPEADHMLASNPNPETETLRALYVVLKAWVVKSTLPPPSAYPRIPDGTLVPASQIAMGYPSLPNSPSPNGVMNLLLDYDFGPLFHYNDESGVTASAIPPIKQVIPVLATKVDADGNEVAGVRSLLLRMPLGTYTSWNPCSIGPFKGQECTLSGGYIPFDITRAQRLASQDPRLSIEERYDTLGKYCSSALRQANELVRQRFLLKDDATRLIEQMRVDMRTGGLLKPRHSH
jgi:hypothetical protein